MLKKRILNFLKKTACQKLGYHGNIKVNKKYPTIPNCLQINDGKYKKNVIQVQSYRPPV